MSQGMAVGAGLGLLREAVGHPQAVEGRAVIGGGRGELVEHLRKTMGAGVADGLEPPARRGEEPGGQRIMNGWTRRAIIASFTSRAPIFLPRYSGVRPTIMPATKMPMMMKISMLIMPTPLPPKMQFSHMPDHGREAGHRVEAVLLRVHRAAGHVCGDRREGGARPRSRSASPCLRDCPGAGPPAGPRPRAGSPPAFRPAPWRWGSRRFGPRDGRSMPGFGLSVS